MEKGQVCTRRSSSLFGPRESHENREENLTKSLLYGNFCTERNNRNDRYYKSRRFRQ